MGLGRKEVRSEWGGAGAGLDLLVGRPGIGISDFSN